MRGRGSGSVIGGVPPSRHVCAVFVVAAGGGCHGSPRDHLLEEEVEEQDGG